jgi:hypothetical protein
MTAVLYGKCGGSRFDVHVRFLKYRQLKAALASKQYWPVILCGVRAQETALFKRMGFQAA